MHFLRSQQNAISNYTQDNVKTGANDAISNYTQDNGKTDANDAISNYKQDNGKTDGNDAMIIITIALSIVIPYQSSSHH